MQFASDLDLQELEYQLYNQVYHSFVDWETAPTTNTEGTLTSSNRRVSNFSVNNGPQKKARYWCERNNTPEYIPISTTPTNETEETNQPSSIFNLNSKSQTGIAKQVKKAKRKSRKKASKNYENFVKYCRENYTSHVEGTSSNDLPVPYNEPVINPANQATQIASNMNVDVPVNSEQKPDHVALNKVATNTKTLNVEEEIVILSDSDESIEEVPLPPPPPVPVYVIDSSDDSDSNDKQEELAKRTATNSVSNTETNSEKGTNNIVADTTHSKLNDTGKMTEHQSKQLPDISTASNESEREESRENIGVTCIYDSTTNEYEESIIAEKSEKDLNEGKENTKDAPNAAELQTVMNVIERAELLNTPDSTVNDFIQSDIEVLNKNHSRFNFTFHECDLEHIGNEFLRPARTASGVPSTDAYETESSCSEIGNPSDAVSVFQEVNFEAPSNEIFSEPDLASFSNFITPNRSDGKSAKSTNNSFEPIPTRALSTQVPNKQQNENKDCDKYVKGNSNDYEVDSDPTILITKKKKKKKRLKKKIDSTKKTLESITEPAESSNSFEKNHLISIATTTTNDNKQSKICLDGNIGNIDLTEKMKASDNSKKAEIKSASVAQTSDKNSFTKPADIHSFGTKKNSTTEKSEDIEICKFNENNKGTNLSNPEVNMSMHFVDDHYEYNDTTFNCSTVINMTNIGNTGILDDKIDSDNDEIIDVCADNTIENPSTNTQQAKIIVYDVPLNFGSGQQFSFVRAWHDMQTKNESTSSSTVTEICQINCVQGNENSECSKVNICNSTGIVVMNDENSSSSEDKEIDVGVETNFAELQGKKNADDEVIVLSDSDAENNSEQILINVEDDLNNVKLEDSQNVEVNSLKEDNSEQLILNTSQNETNVSEQPEKSKGKSKKSSSSKKKLVKNPFNISKTKTFSDYWTTDMQKFYNESWGQENFDINKELATMPSDPSKWKIIPEDMYKVSTRNRGPRCLRCKDFGHTRYECKKLPGPDKCSACGGIGHFHARCPNLMCTTCGRKGGYHTTSCSNCFNYVNIHCSLCHMKGHIHRNCPDLWRRYHITTKNNTYPRTSNLKLKPVNERWCSGCAGRGHFQHECRRTNSEHFPTLPSIVSYEPSYNTVLHVSQMEPEPNMPAFQNTRLSDLRNYKNTLIAHNNARYEGMLRSLRRQCQRHDSGLLEHVENLERDLRNNKFDCKKIKLMYKLRSKVRKYMSI